MEFVQSVFEQSLRGPRDLSDVASCDVTTVLILFKSEFIIALLLSMCASSRSYSAIDIVAFCMMSVMSRSRDTMKSMIMRDTTYAVDCACLLHRYRHTKRNTVSARTGSTNV